MQAIGQMSLDEVQGQSYRHRLKPQREGWSLGLRLGHTWHQVCGGIGVGFWVELLLQIQPLDGDLALFEQMGAAAYFIVDATVIPHL